MNIILGQFIPTGSVVENINAAFKIICTFIYITAVFMCNGIITFGICTAFMIIVIILSKLTFIRIIKGLKGMVFILVFTAVMNLLFTHEGNVIADILGVGITDIALYNTFRISLRLILVLLFSSIITLTTKPMELTMAIEDLLSPLRHFKIPVSEIAMMMGIALRFIPTMYSEVDKIKKAQLSRGASFDEGNIYKRIKALVPIIIPLFVSSFRRADELAMAMEARCYSNTIKRTRLNNPVYGIKDFIALFIVIIIAVSVAIVEFLI